MLDNFFIVFTSLRIALEIVIRNVMSVTQITPTFKESTRLITGARERGSALHLVVLIGEVSQPRDRWEGVGGGVGTVVIVEVGPRGQGGATLGLGAVVGLFPDEGVAHVARRAGVLEAGLRSRSAEDESSYTLSPKDLDVHDAAVGGCADAFAGPDLTAFCRLDELGLVVTGQRLEPDRAVLACQVVEPDQWCRRCGCEGRPRDTGVRRRAHEPLGWRPTTLEVLVRRYRCSGCGCVWRQDTTAAAEPRAKLSRRALRWALEGIVVQHLSVARVAEGLAVAWDSANDAVVAEGKRVLIDEEHRFEGVKVVGVDDSPARCALKREVPPLCGGTPVAATGTSP